MAWVIVIAINHLSGRFFTTVPTSFAVIVPVVIVGISIINMYVFATTITTVIMVISASIANVVVVNGTVAKYVITEPFVALRTLPSVSACTVIAPSTLDKTATACVFIDSSCVVLASVAATMVAAGQVTVSAVFAKPTFAVNIMTFNERIDEFATFNALIKTVLTRLAIELATPENDVASKGFMKAVVVRGQEVIKFFLGNFCDKTSAVGTHDLNQVVVSVFHNTTSLKLLS